MSAGPRHEALIVTNDPVRPEIRVEIVVRAATTVGFEPGEIDFGRIDAKRLPAREVVTLRIENGLPPSQDNSTITSDLPFLKGEIISWDLNGKSISALVTLEPNAPTGEFVGRLTIALSGSEHEHSTGIVGCVLREYFAEPAAIVLGPIRTGSLDSSRTISLRARNTQQSFTILQVKGGDGWPMNGLSVSLSADDPRSILLTCNSYDLARPLGRGRFRTAIQISILSQDGAFTELNIPIELILAE